jgi:dTDP-4-dehydrorhamnose reductase
MKILVLGASGMIGSTMFRVLANHPDYDVYGTSRSVQFRAFFSQKLASRLISGVDLASTDNMLKLFSSHKPDVVVNCAGLTKHLPEGNDPLPALTMNAMLPHRLSECCALGGARLIHVSTDCVFSGRKGNYTEQDAADAEDVYGKSKFLGEVGGPGLVTLRTSTIGHELATQHGLLEWFLAQTACKGFQRAIFSGLPSVCFAEVVRDWVIPDSSLTGLYHVGAEPINKYDLLCLIADVYGKNIEIAVDTQFTIDRSLNCDRFAKATGYRAAGWPELIEKMKSYQFC